MDPFSIALMGAGMGAQVFGMFQQHSAEEKLMGAQLGQERMLAARDRLQQVRQLRTATAQVQQAGANQGVSGASSIAGGTSTAYGQAGQNIQYINNQQMFGQVITKDRQAISDAQGIQQLGSDVFSIGSKISGGGF